MDILCVNDFVNDVKFVRNLNPQLIIVDGTINNESQHLQTNQDI